MCFITYFFLFPLDHYHCYELFSLLALLVFLKLYSSPSPFLRHCLREMFQYLECLDALVLSPGFIHFSSLIFPPSKAAPNCFLRSLPVSPPALLPFLGQIFMVKVNTETNKANFIQLNLFVWPAALTCAKSVLSVLDTKRTLLVAKDFIANVKNIFK